MAKKSKIAKNAKRREIVARYAATRVALKKIVSDPRTPEEKKAEAVRRLQKIPRDASPVRIRNRCQVTGRSRGFLRKFSMSRIAIRDLGNSGQIAGLKKASW